MLLLPPAGAGKTSLLNVLAGKAHAYGVQAGSIAINGRPDRLERYKPVMGFVPQVGGRRLEVGQPRPPSGRAPALSSGPSEQS